jgi:hypothetical protein
LQFKQLNTANAVAYSHQRPPHTKDFQMTNQDSPVHPANEISPPVYGERIGPRIVIDKETGYPCVASRPGARKITPEDVKKMLEDFP